MKLQQVEGVSPFLPAALSTVHAECHMLRCTSLLFLPCLHVPCSAVLRPPNHTRSPSFQRNAALLAALFLRKSSQALRFLVEEMRGAQASRVMFILNPTGDPQEARCGHWQLPWGRFSNPMCC